MIITALVEFAAVIAGTLKVYAAERDDTNGALRVAPTPTGAGDPANR